MCEKLRPEILIMLKTISTSENCFDYQKLAYFSSKFRNFLWKHAFVPYKHHRKRKSVKYTFLTKFLTISHFKTSYFPQNVEFREPNVCIFRKKWYQKHKNINNFPKTENVRPKLFCGCLYISYASFHHFLTNFRKY